jgi:predicted RNase H-like nuclease (RuvC/YqgF family)
LTLYESQDELNKQKSMNATLQAELDAVQGTNGAEAGSRTRAATSGRATPTADPEGSRQQQRVLAHNTELQQQLEGAREELDALRDVCTGREREVEIMRKRATDTEARLSEAKKELERLQNTLSDGRTLDDLEQENAELRQENETLNHQVMLLLADDDVSSPRPKSGLDFGKVVRRRSASSTVDSEDHGRDLTLEMQEWQHNFSPRIGST